MGKFTVFLVLMTMIVVGASPMGAEACACGPDKGIKVASGTSEGGVKWSIHVARSKNFYSIDFESRWSDTNSSDVTGVSAWLTGKEIRNLTFFATTGSGLGNKRESDVSGAAGRRVKTLIVKMKSGERLRFSPKFAPRSVHDRIGRARTLRYFDVFYSNKETPVLMTGLDGNGEVVDRFRSNRGSFN